MLKQKLLVVLSIGAFAFVVFTPKSNASISFTISTDVQTFNKDDEIPIHVAVSGLTSCATCYLQAAFTSISGSPRYLGLSKNASSSFIPYDSSPSPDAIKQSFFSFQPQNDSWEGTLVAKIDASDSDYKGGGEYKVKVIRYTGNSSSGSDSNDLTLTIVDTSPTATSVPSSTPKPPTPTHTPKPPTNTPTPKSSSTASTKPPTQIPTQVTVKSPSFGSNSIKKISGVTTTVLGSATKASASATPINHLTPTISKPHPTAAQVKTLAASTENLSKAIIGIGVFFLLICGILLFRNLRKSNDITQ